MIKNTHRDLNIALINELAMIFNKMGIITEQVLQAAAYLQLQMSILPFSSGEIGPRVLLPLDGFSRSVAAPLTTDAANITGFLNMLDAARDAKVKRFCLRREQQRPRRPPRSAQGRRHHRQATVAERRDQICERALRRCLWQDLRAAKHGPALLNVFGPRQDPNGAYAAVNPKWIASLIQDEPVYIHLHLNLLPSHPHPRGVAPVHRDYRADDVRHSLADICKVASLLGYQPIHRIDEGIKVAMEWYVSAVFAYTAA